MHSRIFPKGTRVDSSNLDPVPAWVAGNQLVALNYQTPGLPMMLNDGLFRENGGCGYVLKPPFLLDSRADPSSPIRLTVNMLSGQQLPKIGGSRVVNESVNPYVLVSTHSALGEKEKTERTKTVASNGLNPVWNEVGEFRGLLSPIGPIIKFRFCNTLFFRCLRSTSMIRMSRF